jgi:hypothetical protein
MRRSGVRRPHRRTSRRTAVRFRMAFAAVGVTGAAPADTLVAFVAALARDACTRAGVAVAAVVARAVGHAGLVTAARAAATVDAALERTAVLRRAPRDAATVVAEHAVAAVVVRVTLGSGAPGGDEVRGEAILAGRALAPVEARASLRRAGADGVRRGRHGGGVSAGDARGRRPREGRSARRGRGDPERDEHRGGETRRAGITSATAAGHEGISSGPAHANQER